jgi:Predicted membrane protein (DUF2232)
MQFVAIGIGAGVVSALLFGVVITGSPLAMLLSVIAPIPIFIAALGWNHRCGLIAAGAGALAVGLALTTAGGVAFALGWGLPAWWLAYLALLGRPAPDGAMEWYPTGRLLLWIAASAALITVLGVFALGQGSYEAYQDALQQGFAGMFPDPGATPQDAGARSDILSFFVSALPLLFAFNFVFVLSLNLWLAGKAVQISGRLPRPWPSLPALTMPKVAIAFLLVATFACFLPDLFGVSGLALTGGLLAAFALQGLAFIHHASRQRPGRAFMLSTVYVLTFLMSSISLPLLALLGLADVAFVLRSRFWAGGAGPGSPSS